jgi:hypothetical protein
MNARKWRRERTGDYSLVMSPEPKPPSLRPDKLLDALRLAHQLNDQLERVNIARAPRTVREPVQAARSAARFAILTLTQAAGAARDARSYVISEELDDMDQWLADALLQVPDFSPARMNLLWEAFFGRQR